MKKLSRKKRKQIIEKRKITKAELRKQQEHDLARKKAEQLKRQRELNLEKKKQTNREKAKKQKELTAWKFKELENLGIDPFLLKTTYLRKVKKADILSGNVNADKYPFLFPSNFDFNKKYFFPTGKGWFIMFLDYTGESTIEELMYRFMNFSNDTLIKFLESIVKMSKTYSKSGKEGSSGRAGTFRSQLSTPENAKKMYNMENDNLQKSFNSAKKRYHTGSNKYWQNVGQGEGVIINDITGRETLIILNALLYNCTEQSRDYYRGTYSMLTYCFPDFKKFLPKP